MSAFPSLRSGRKRLLLRWLLALVACAALLIALLYASLLYNARRVEEAFFVRHAQLRDPHWLSKLEEAADGDDVLRKRFGFFVHRIDPGAGTVIAQRVFDGGDTGVDDEGYSKVTIWLPGDAPASPVTFALEQHRELVVVWSEGGSAWPNTGCSGTIASGTLRITPRDGRIDVALDGMVQPLGNARSLHPCQAQAIALNFAAEERRFDELGPWHGVVRDPSISTVDELFRP